MESLHKIITMYITYCYYELYYDKNLDNENDNNSKNYTTNKKSLQKLKFGFIICVR